MTEQEVLKGKLLSPDTMNLLTEEIQVLEATLCNITFSANPEEREVAILTYVEAQAKRNALAALVDGSNETYKYLEALGANSQHRS